MDGLSLPLVVLTAFLGFIVVLLSWKEHTRVKEYFAWLLLLETSILGVFASLDLLLFFIFWEIEIIPMYFLISVWGAGRKDYSAMKYVIYTLFGSAFMLAGILSLYFTTGSLNMVELAQNGLGMVQSVMPAAAIFFLLFIGFAIKLPMFPLHTWLPDAHTDAPTAGQRNAGRCPYQDGRLRNYPALRQLLPRRRTGLRFAALYSGGYQYYLRRGSNLKADTISNG